MSERASTKGRDDELASAWLRPEPSSVDMLQRCLAILEGLAKDVDACSHLDDDFFQTSICTELREHLAKPRQSFLQHLYDREINFAISSFWDGGFTVKLGDEMNGFKAETCVNTMQEAMAWLVCEAAARYPSRLTNLADANQSNPLSQDQEIAGLREEVRRKDEALDGIYTYCNDTLSGRADGGPDDRAWQREAVIKARNLARPFARPEIEAARKRPLDGEA